MIIKAISLTQPWASLMAIGAKKIETRSWRTGHKGIVAIHAAKTFPTWASEYCFTEPFSTVLNPAGYAYARGLPLGKVLAIGILAECAPTSDWLTRGISAQEQAFGDYGPKRYGLRFKDVMKLAEPIQQRGSLSLWDWDVPAEGEVAEILTQLGALV